MQTVKHTRQETSIFIHAEELCGVIQHVFQSMLGVQLEVKVEEGEPATSEKSKVLASLGITGDWNGALILECGAETACMLAGAVLGCGQISSVDEDVKDVLGELANIVAGNLKKRLPGNSFLTLPCVVEGSNFSLQVLNGEEVFSQHFLCRGQGLDFSLVLQESSGNGSSPAGHRAAG